MNKKSLELKFDEIESKLIVIETLSVQIKDITNSLEDYYNCDFVADEDIDERVKHLINRCEKVSKLIGG